MTLSLGLLGGIQFSLSWLLAHRLRRIFGARRWLSIVIALLAWALMGSIPYEALRGSALVRVATWSIPSESMLPTLRVGDIIVTDRWDIAFGQPSRGDVMVFNTPSGHPYVHRLIGLPGDRVQYRNGRLWLNGSEVQWADRGTYTWEGRPGTARVIEEVIDGHAFQTLDITRQADVDDTREFLVPVGHFFMLGDNRDNSLDSRIDVYRRGYGMVPFEALIGRVYHRVGPDPGPLK